MNESRKGTGSFDSNTKYQKGIETFVRKVINEAIAFNSYAFNEGQRFLFLS
jgi:hypothetical protein